MTTHGDMLAQGWRHHQAGNLVEAERIYRLVLQADPGNVDAWYLCGVACQMADRLDEAIACYRQALRFRPQYAEVLNNLGVALAVQGLYAEAVPAYEQALQAKPGYAEAHNNLGLALTELGRLDQAVAQLQEALRLNPSYPEAHYNLGNAWQKAGRFDGAVASYEYALRLRPNYGEALNNLGAALTRRGNLDDAVAFLHQAQHLRPGDANVFGNLGNALKEQGKIDEARIAYQQALRLNPDSAGIHSNYLACLNYDPRLTPLELFEEHGRWADRHARPRGDWRAASAAHDRSPDRVLRVGYVSPDFYQHAVARFLEPIIANHDPERVSTYCYAEVAAPDEVTARFRKQAGQWRPTVGLSDRQVAGLVADDRIDILVDLAGHTGHGRPQLFAYRAAPVQITYLGYPNTTGMTAIDYRLTDAVADPPGEPICHSEQLIRLPGCFCCYAPPANAPAVSPLPARASGALTFGSLQNLAKLNDQVLDLWSEVLHALPHSRLLIFRHTLTGPTRDYFAGQFARRGIDAGRLELRHHAEQPGGFLGVYGSVDIALDTLPWSSHTTCCEALWMGVPVLTLAGDRHAGRMAASILTCLDLGDLIAWTRKQYVERAVQAASHVDRLGHLRTGLRERMLTSPVCDGKSFTRSLEDVYRDLWRR